MKNKKVKSKLFKLEPHYVKGEYFLTILRTKDNPNQDVFWFTAEELRELNQLINLTSRCCICGETPYRIYPVCKNHKINNRGRDA